MVRHVRLFVPILAGATLRERLVACLGALIGIALVELGCRLIIGGSSDFPLIVAPIGASAVLLFAVPASPLAQPWPIVGGNTISAVIGLAVAHLALDPILAGGLAVALATAVMSLTRCLHPPSGAVAFTAVLGGPAVAAAGLWFPLMPVALDSVLLVALGIAFHKFARRSYPHRPGLAPANAHGTLDPPADRRIGFRGEDVDAALAVLGESFDIARGDLDRLLRQVELQAALRSHGHLACADIMSRDVIKVDLAADAATARRLLLDHTIRTLPVVDAAGRLAGTVGLRELETGAASAGAAAVAGATASPADPALALLPVLTDGRAHAVVVVDGDRHVVGLITQTDLLAAVARLLPEAA